MGWYEENKRTAWLLVFGVLILVAIPFRATLLPGYFGTPTVGGDEGRATQIYLEMEAEAVAPYKAEIEDLRARIELDAADDGKIDPGLLARQAEISDLVTEAITEQYEALSDQDRALIDRFFPHRTGAEDAGG